ncbi:MAG: hypothetical protein R3F37_13245 [Candidatus Competibacteraceae bacterium]
MNAARKAAIEQFQEGKQANFNLDATLTLFLHHCGNQPSLIRRFVDIQLSTAYADGSLHPVKQERLLYICNRLGFSRLQLRQVGRVRKAPLSICAYRTTRRTTALQTGIHRSRPKADLLAEAYATLGLKREATVEEINKRAYRRLLNTS